MTSRPTTQLLWFKRDLRVDDHPALAMAAETGPVVAFYAAEPEWWAQPTHSARQWAFVAECLESLRADLARYGAPLLMRAGDTVEILGGLHAALGPIALWSSQETGDAWSFARDQRVAAWARDAGIEWREIRQSGVVRRLKTRDGWAKSWDAWAAASVARVDRLTPAGVDLDLGSVPTASDLGLAGDPCPQRQIGGRAHAVSTLQSFLTVRGRDYRREMSTPVAAFDACSRLSPHLAWGTLSSREAAQAAQQRLIALRADEHAAKRGWIGSVESFLARLHWRCHFIQKLEDEPEIEHRCFHSAYEGVREFDHDPIKLAAWANGETGLPFVDACMRALTATGYMNFRMRSMLTAVASYHLWLDWRRSGPVLARTFTDFEPGIHWSQMQMQSGVTGINTTRVYNPVKQSIDQDPGGVFIRRWVPQLEGVPTEFIHTPWKMDAAAQKRANCVLGRNYPSPIVDHEEAAREAKAKIHAVRRDEAFQLEKRRVMRKHASRKPGREGSPRRRSPPPEQMKLDL